MDKVEIKTEPDRPFRCHEKASLGYKVEIILLGSWIFQLPPCPYFITLSLDVKDVQHETKSTSETQTVCEKILTHILQDSYWQVAQSQIQGSAEAWYQPLVKMAVRQDQGPEAEGHSGEKDAKSDDNLPHLGV